MSLFGLYTQSCVSIGLFFSFYPQVIKNNLMHLNRLILSITNVQWTHKRVHSCKDRYLLYKQFLAHGDALIEPLLVFLQELLLFIYLSPQVTVSLLRKDTRGCVKFGCVVRNIIHDMITCSTSNFLPCALHQNSGFGHWTHPEQVIYSPLFFFQVQTLVALQSSKFQAC